MSSFTTSTQRDVRSAETIAKLRALHALIEAARISADTLNTADKITEGELFDSLAVAQLSVLRLLDDEGAAGEWGMASGEWAPDNWDARD